MFVDVKKSVLNSSFGARDQTVLTRSYNVHGRFEPVRCLRAQSACVIQFKPNSDNSAS